MLNARVQNLGEVIPQPIQQISLVQTNYGAFAATTGSAAAFAQTCTLGNTIIVAVWGYGNSSSITSVSDSASHTYTQIGCSNETSANVIPVCLFYADVTNEVGGLVVSAVGTGLVDMDIAAAEFSGLATLSLDTSTSNFSAVAVPAASVGPTGATSVANELVVAAVSLDAANNPILPTAGFSSLFTDNGTTFATGQVVYKIISSTGPQSHAWTYSTVTARFAAVIATFRGL